MIGNKTTHELSILWIKSSLSTILPCLPGLAFTENIKNLHLSAPTSPTSPTHLLGCS
jgi:hypothetical protein